MLFGKTSQIQDKSLIIKTLASNSTAYFEIKKEPFPS